MRPLLISIWTVFVLTSAPAVVLAQTPTNADKVWTVRSGDTLDKVIQSNYPNSPLRIELLRESIIEKNPSAFSPRSPKLLITGSQLKLPDHAALMQRYFKASGAELQDGARDARKGWIRYP